MDTPGEVAVTCYRGDALAEGLSAEYKAACTTDPDAGKGRGEQGHGPDGGV